MAVRADGTGDVTKTHIAWTLSRGAPLTPSPLLVGDELYVVSDNGIASCLDAVDGSPRWQVAARRHLFGVAAFRRWPDLLPVGRRRHGGHSAREGVSARRAPTRSTVRCWRRWRCPADRCSFAAILICIASAAHRLDSRRTPHFGLRTSDFGLRTNFAPRTSNGLRTPDSELRTL